jgi:hypothetical protein
MADPKAKIPTSSALPSKSKRQAKSATVEDPYATARVRAIFNPEESDLINAKLEDIQSTGATVTVAAAAEGTIERIVSVGGSPSMVEQVCYCEINTDFRDMLLFLRLYMDIRPTTR